MGHAATIVAEYKALLPRTEALVREFQPALSAGAVIGAVTRCRTELRRCGVRRGLAGATEDMARAQLRRRAAATRGTACPRTAQAGSAPVPALPATPVSGLLPGSGTA
jgi:hypothetical protein